MGEGNQPNKPNQKLTKLNHPKNLLVYLFFCELSLNAKFQLPRLCVSCISTKHNFFDKKKLGGENFFGENSFDEIFFAKFFISAEKKFWQNFCVQFLCKIFTNVTSTDGTGLRWS